MCGLAGIFDVRGRREIDPELVQRMNDVQRHRGPDDAGIHAEPGVALAHRRLSIIDVATGHQPLYNEDRSVCVIFNGEIYNFQALIPELQARGHVFSTRSDTEVIVHAWEEWGEACVTRFRGMFAFALWDARRETLFLARDRLGVKPLHYAILPDGFVIFASELKSLLVVPTLSRALDPCAIEDYFTLGYIPDPKTVFKSACKLPPGHTLAIRRGTDIARPREYWDVTFTLDRRLSVEDACDELRARLSEAVRLRLISEVPLGAFLSGGVDSSAVVATMAGLSADPVTTCSIAFSDPLFDESAYAEMVARRYGTTHHSERVDSDDFDLIDTLAGVYDEPYADSSAMPTYRVCQLARKHVTVALSGDGADESFGGYSRYREQLAEAQLRRLVPQSVRAPLFGFLAQVYPSLSSGPRIFRAKALFAAMADDAVGAYLQAVSIVRARTRQQLFTPAFRSAVGDYRTEQHFRAIAKRAPTDDVLGTLQYLDLHTYLPGDINTKVDRAAMAHSLEVREPMMDHELIEWLASLPSDLKVNGNESKYLLKKAMEPSLPAEVLYRPKRGFAVPLAVWFRGPLRARVRTAVGGAPLAETGWFNDGYLEQVIDAHEQGRQDNSALLWSLLMFESFLRQAGIGTPESSALKRAA